MATDTDEQSPFTRPGFIAAAIVVALVVVLGIVIAIVAATRGDDADTNPTTAPTSSNAAPTPETEAPADNGDAASVCGLEGVELEGTLTVAPEATWEYQGTAAFPAAKSIGPGETDPAGFRYCFQHTPEGAVFAAAYASIVSTDPAVVPSWIEYFTAPGPYRDQLIPTSAGSGEATDLRIRIAGFRLLAYDGATASVDVAMVSSVDGQSVNLSAVYPLVWVDGDWKLSTDTPEPGSVVSIPDLVGYVPWGE